MRHAGRLIAILIGGTTWCLASTTVAFAQRLPDPGERPGDVPALPAALGSSLWEVAAMAALGVLLVVGIVGLTLSLRHSGRLGTSQRSQRTPRAHA